LKLLLIGGGGREHALAWRLGQDPRVHQILAVPGNPGIAQLGQCLPAPKEIEGYAHLAEAERVDLTVVGPEATLVAGIADVFAARRLPIVGPRRKAAQLEGSKIFAKRFFERAGIPTARSHQTANYHEALDALKDFAYPVVIKADGLAAGKGVIIARNLAEAKEAAMKLGPALVIEEFLEGEEVSFIGISNGSEVFPLEASQDHKRVRDGDQGPNTGGMGAYCDGRILTAAQATGIVERVMLPAVGQMAREGMPFTGFLYAGLMMTADGPKVLEFNVRLGDPETQALLHRLRAGFLELLEFSAGLVETPAARLRPEYSAGPSVCVVLAAGGYPEQPRTGDAITGIAGAESLGAIVFQAGTKLAGHSLVTAGGRVLGVTASGADLAGAIDAAYAAAGRIHFEGMHYRRDIGAKGLKRWG
jgi:phosphoribosylamine---glycine ligase